MARKNRKEIRPNKFVNVQLSYRSVDKLDVKDLYDEFDKYSTGHGTCIHDNKEDFDFSLKVWKKKRIFLNRHKIKYKKIIWIA